MEKDYGGDFAHLYLESNRLDWLDKLQDYLLTIEILGSRLMYQNYYLKRLYEWKLLFVFILDLILA